MVRQYVGAAQFVGEKIIRAKDIMLPNEIKIPVRLYGAEWKNILF